MIVVGKRHEGLPYSVLIRGMSLIEFNDAYLWCNQNIGMKLWDAMFYKNDFEFYFTNSADAVLFKMVFG